MLNFLKKIKDKLQICFVTTKNASLYKINGLRQDEKIRVQKKGEQDIMHYKTEYLALNNKLQKRFSQIDVHTIMQMSIGSYYNKTKKIDSEIKYQMVEQYYSRKKQKQMIVIKTHGSDISIVKSAENLSCNHKLIMSMDALDANRIGYIAGYERAILDCLNRVANKKSKAAI